MRLPDRDCTIALALLLALLAANWLAPGAAEPARLAVFDQWQRLAPHGGAEAGPVIVDVDDASLAELGQWPWPRTYLAAIVERLAEMDAAVIAFDIVFSEPDRFSPPVLAETLTGLDDDARAALRRARGHDTRFADAIAAAPVVLARALAPGDGRAVPPAPGLDVVVGGAGVRPALLLRRDGVVANLAELREAARAVGLISFAPERGGVARRIPLVAEAGDLLHPTLALQALRVAGGGHASIAVATDAEGRSLGVSLGRREIPTDPQGRVWVHAAPHDPSRFVPAADVLTGRVAQDRVAGRIVLVGTSAIGLLDIKATPVASQIPGVEVHAQLIDNLLTGGLHRSLVLEWLVEPLAALLLGLLMVAAVPRLGPAGGVLLLAGVMAGCIAASWLAFSGFGVLADPVLPLLAAALPFLVLSYAKYVREGRQRRAIHQAFDQYLAPALVAQLIDDPDRLRLGGEEREMTFLFTDLAGFTAFAEAVSPETLVDVLNRYLDGMCRIVMAHGGTIDKIVGDAVHAMFNAPTAQPDHARRAVACALELDAFAQAFVTETAAAGRPLGITRIGVNTGRAVVGNFGGARRFDYTAHGDSINTAARLESANKQLGTRIAVAAGTLAQCEGVPARPIGVVFLMGKDQGVATYEPLTAAAAADPRMARYRAAYDLLAAGDPAAAAAFAGLAADWPEDGPTALHRDRAAAGARDVLLRLESK